MIVAELWTIWSVKTQKKKNPAAIMACEALANLSYRTGMSICKMGTMASGKGVRLELVISLKTIEGNFRTVGVYMIQCQQKD